MLIILKKIGANNGRKRISNSHLVTNNVNSDKQIQQQHQLPSQAQTVDSPVQQKAAEPPKPVDQPPPNEPKKNEKKPKQGNLELSGTEIIYFV